MGFRAHAICRTHLTASALRGTEHEHESHVCMPLACRSVVRGSQHFQQCDTQRLGVSKKDHAWYSASLDIMQGRPRFSCKRQHCLRLCRQLVKVAQKSKGFQLPSTWSTCWPTAGKVPEGCQLGAGGMKQATWVWSMRLPFPSGSPSNQWSKACDMRCLKCLCCLNKKFIASVWATSSKI